MTSRRNRTLATLGIAALAAVGLATPAHAAAGEQPDPPSWGLDRIDQREGGDNLYKYETRAETVTVYVIGTGVAPDTADLAGRVAPGKDFVDGDDDADDGNGNGTWLAGIVGGEEFGVAKDVRIVPVRVLDDQGSGTTEGVIEGITWVRDNAEQPAVALVGLGGSADQALDAAVAALAETVPVVVPSGNDATDAENISPARVPEALTVAAADSSDGAAATSNHGSAIDLFAPGVDIPAEGLDGPVTYSGSTAAAAHVAGGAALYRALHPDATATAAAAAVVDNATADVLTNVPDGTANRLLYTLTP